MLALKIKTLASYIYTLVIWLLFSPWNHSQNHTNCSKHAKLPLTVLYIASERNQNQKKRQGDRNDPNNQVKNINPQQSRGCVLNHSRNIDQKSSLILEKIPQPIRKINSFVRGEVFLEFYQKPGFWDTVRQPLRQRLSIT